MDNEEILKAMGFEYLTGDLWQRNDMGVISINSDDTLNKICCEIHKLGQEHTSKRIKDILNL